MNRISCMAMLLLIAATYGHAQRLYFPKPAAGDSAAIAIAMPLLAKQVLKNYVRDDNKAEYLNNVFRLQMLAGDNTGACETIDTLRTISLQNGEPYASTLYIQYELFCKARLKRSVENISFEKAFAQLFNNFFPGVDDKTAIYISTAFTTLNGVDRLQLDWNNALHAAKDTLGLEDAIALCRSYELYNVYKNIEPLAAALLQADDNRRYIIEDSVMIKTNDGGTLSAVVVRKRNITASQPTALFFFLYSNLSRSLYEAKQSAAHGYVGIVADTRGKRLSPDAIEPYEHETKDVNTVIGWITRQPWSNGQVGMYGGSYSGYAQWAATKHMHPALKTIVPYVAAIPGLGLPMENNVFLNANYQWAFYITNNKYVDDSVNNDNRRWQNMRNNWYTGGAAYRKIDSVDGQPNKLLQRWLQHPSFDGYWQSKVPYKDEYANINIPVLTITGYYDDGQISALHYLREHYKYNKNANHYLIIGPYDHFGAQRGGSAVLRDYPVDPVALISTREITYQWLDYIMKGSAKPALLKDKINYEVMGANIWKHAPTLEKMADTALTFYLSEAKDGAYHQLLTSKPESADFLPQEVNLADRSTANGDYYPDPIIRKKMDTSSGLFFISKAFDKPIQVNGMFSGELKAMINKRDLDICITLYEVMPNDEYFDLSYFLGRASYAEDMSVRKLLRPGQVETIPFSRSRMVSRQLSIGSRLLVVLNIDKNPFAQINYGTGKDVSDETISDAKEPLKIKWYSNSYIKIPVSK